MTSGKSSEVEDLQEKIYALVDRHSLWCFEPENKEALDDVQIVYEIEQLIEAEVQDALARQATPTVSGKQADKPCEHIVFVDKVCPCGKMRLKYL